MQLRRFGSLLPLGECFIGPGGRMLAPFRGASDGEAAQDASQIKPVQITAKLSGSTPDALQHVQVSTRSSTDATLGINERFKLAN